MLVLVTGGCWKPLRWYGRPSFMRLAQRKRVKITYYSPQLDQGNEEVIRVCHKVRSNRLLYIINLVLCSDD